MSVKVDGNGPITGADSTFSTGDFKWRQAKSAGAGWIAATGGTIGNAGSGATSRANADTFALFSLWWSDYTDVQLPIYTSGGALSSRGANALADWNALKRLAVFDVRGRFVRAQGTINGLTFVNGNGYADMMQNITGGWNELYGGIQDNSGTGAFQTTGSTVGAAGSNVSVPKASAMTFDASRVARTGPETAPVSIVMLPCYKL